ncbi:hypothetical protein WA026_012379 [Henosepilachna vigintioctopunctata]|uniref:ABTB2/3 histone-like domain-containing protein n=1 Tax=Henosepilachna vigintioctopunctata TaxID=420089 RepID=A0AAW1UWX0_9CUCU
MLTFFGMQVDRNFEKFSTIGSNDKNKKKDDLTCENNTNPKDELQMMNKSLSEVDSSSRIANKHKSVIYVNDSTTNIDEESREDIMKNELIDEWMSLCSRENSSEIHVVFKNTFSLASQIINEIHSSNVLHENNNDGDDFPLGMEADLLKYYLKDRLSCNSKKDHSYQHLQSTDSSGSLNNELPSTTNSTNNCNKTNAKPFASTNTLNQSTTTVRMVSPKRRVEQFQQLFVANNVKTSTFSEQFEKNNLSNAKHSSNSHEFKHICHHNSIMVPEKDTGPKAIDCGVNAVNSLHLSSQNDVKMNGDLNNDEHRIVTPRQHHHVSVQELRMQRHQQCNSSSDDNRSSGHASMSDTGHSSPREISCNERATAGVIQKPLRNRTNAYQYNRSRHRATPARLHVPWSGGGGLEDIKLALQQLTIRSNTSTSTYSSISAGSESSEPAVRRLMRHSSLETINTNITSADEFVWVDSHNRLVELQHLPWTNHCILRVLQAGRCRDYMNRVSVDIIPRLSYLLQRALVRIGRETQRLSSTLGISTKHDVTVSFRIILCPPLADSCIKAALRAAAMLSMSGDGVLKQSKSSRAGLQLHVGRFHRWMTDLKIARFIHEYAAVYLCAGMENLLEEILLQCLPGDADASLTATLLEHAIASNGDMWGLLQPYAHLNAGRIASGALALPRWASQSSICSSRDSGRSSAPSEPSLMTTCVGSLGELQDLIDRMQPRIPLCQKAVRALFYFMRCSQLEQGEQGNHIVQELCYERAYVVLPPLVEWLRVATAHGEHRYAAVLDKDDIMQAARLLLPGVDCPVRALGEEAMRANTGRNSLPINDNRTA